MGEIVTSLRSHIAEPQRDSKFWKPRTHRAPHFQASPSSDRGRPNKGLNQDAVPEVGRSSRLVFIPKYLGPNTPVEVEVYITIRD